MPALQQSAWQHDVPSRPGARRHSASHMAFLRWLDRAGTLAMQACVYAVVIWLGAAFVRHGTETLHLLVHGPAPSQAFVTVLPLK